jgi:hypothetical protein
MARRVRGGHVGEDMTLQGVATDGEEKRLTPAALEGRGDVKEERYEEADVLHNHRLCLQVEQHGSLMLKEGIAEVRGVGSGGVVIEVVLILTGTGVLRRWSDRSTLKSGVIECSLEARFRGVTLLLSDGGLALSLGRAGQGSVAGGLGLALGFFLGEACGFSLLSGGHSIGIIGDDCGGRGSGSGCRRGCRRGDNGRAWEAATGSCRSNDGSRTGRRWPGRKKLGS